MFWNSIPYFHSRFQFPSLVFHSMSVRSYLIKRRWLWSFYWAEYLACRFVLVFQLYSIQHKLKVTRLIRIYFSEKEFHKYVVILNNFKLFLLWFLYHNIFCMYEKCCLVLHARPFIQCKQKCMEVSATTLRRTWLPVERSRKIKDRISAAF